MFPEAELRETLRFKGNKTNCYPKGPVRTKINNKFNFDKRFLKGKPMSTNVPLRNLSL